MRYFYGQVNRIFHRQAVKQIRQANRLGMSDASYAQLVDKIRTVLYPDLTRRTLRTAWSPGKFDRHQEDVLKGLLKSKLQLFQEMYR